MTEEMTDPQTWESLPAPKQSVLLEWIALTVKPAKTPHPHRTSYGMKHDFGGEGFYVRNDVFKGAMRASGYEPVDPRELNWEFRCRSRYRGGFTIEGATAEERAHYLEMLERVK